MDVGPNGSVLLQGANISLGGEIIAPGGSISLQAFLTPLTLANITLPEIVPASVSGIMTLKEDAGDLKRGEKVVVLGDPAAGDVTVYAGNGTHATLSGALLDPLQAGRVTLASTGRIDASGRVVNDTKDATISPIVLSGGSVTISGYDVALAGGSSIDVSGGFHRSFLSGSQGVTYGNAGSIIVSAGQDSSFSTIHQGRLALGGMLSGYAGVGSQAGSLALKAPAFGISEDPLPDGDPRVISLTPDFFNKGGFSSFSLTGVGLETGESDSFLPGVSVAEGTHLHPRVTALIVDALGSRLILPGGPLAAAPSLKLAATGLSDDSRNPGEKMLIRGAVEIGKDSVITLDPQVIANAGFPSYKTASLEMRAAVVSFQGKAIVPGGSISIAGSSQYPSNETQPGAAQVTVDLGPAASLSVAGKSLFTRDPLGLRARYGTVLPGGSVALSGNILARGPVVDADGVLLDPGSFIDASGASSMVDLLPYQLGLSPGSQSSATLPYQLDSAGGSISLTGKQALRSDATLVARSGGKTAAGGSLSISSGRFNDGITPFLSTDLGLAISQSGPVISDGFADAGSSAAGLEFENVDGIQSGGGHVAVSSFASGGFQNLTLGGNVFFSGPVSLSVPGLLKVATGGILSADAKTELSATAAVLGTPFLAPLAPNDPLRSAALDPNSPNFFAPPTWGDGELFVKASRIDLGNLSLQGIGKVSLEAPGGSIRGDGSFVMAGDLTLKAGIIYPVSGTDFRAVAFNHKDDGTAASSGGMPGSITVLSGGSVPLPLSALGSLSLQAETILQSGTLAAPFGTITLGRTDSQAATPDPLSGLTAPVTATMRLADSSVSTVSGMDSIKGLGISVPYGTSLDGISWIDPSGTAITGTGLKDKAVSVAGSDIVMEGGAIVDISGGGAVTARQWVNGLGGTRDLLNDNSGSWAIIPGYSASFTPKGYEEGMVAEGMRIDLKQGAAGLAPGTYTLLPASYASQPGAYLLSRSSMQGLTESTIKPDGTAVLPGTLMSGLDPEVQTPGITTLFEIFSPSVIASKAEYRTLNADTLFAGLPASGKTADGGRLQLVASASMNLAGSVATMAATKGRAAAIDIAATAPVIIAGSGGPSEEASAGTIVLDAAVLSSWKAGSLLIGGTRSITSSGEVRITSVSESITLDAGTRLEGAEVILATAPRTYAVKKDETIATIAKALGGDVTEEDLLSANQLSANATLTAGQILRIPGSHASLRLSDGSAVVSSGGASPSTLLLEGNGALLRVGDAQGVIRRTGFDPVATDVDGATPLASLVLGQDVIISGAGVTFDSTSGTTLDALASVSASALRLSAGLISVNGEDPGALTLSGSLLEELNSSTILKSLSLTSYSTMILHDGAVLGSDNLGSLAIHAAAITGDGGDASMVARALSLDNASGSSLSSDGNNSGNSSGKLSLKSDTLALGIGELYLDGFSEVAAEAKNGVALSGKGVFSTAGDLTIDAPVVVGLGGASTGIRAAGDLSLTSSGKNPGVLTPGLGSSLAFEGATVSEGIPILAPSGVISLKSTSGDLELSALLDAGGVAKSFPGVVKYTDAGVISLSSGGDIVLQTGNDLNLSAQSLGGSAGTLRVTAPSGSLNMEGNPFRASKGNGGKGGAFVADLFGYGDGNLDPLSTVLSAAGFTEKQDLRIRSGDVTLASATAHTFILSTDLGSITINGTIDASGKTGGSISLFAGQSVILSDGSLLNVHGDSSDAAGKGGLIDLEAGSSGAAVIAEAGRVGTATEYAHGVSVIDLKSGSKLKLGVGADQDAGTVLLKAPQTADVTDLQINPIASSIEQAGSIIAVGNHLLDVAAEGPVSIDPLAKWNVITTPLPGQSVLGDDGGAYKLTADASSYAQFVALEVAPGEITDPATSSYWTKIAAAWDPEVGYASGAKAVGADGLIYTATAAYPANGSKPEPGTEEGAFAWVLAADEGNYKALALQNAATFDANTLAAARKDFAGAYAESIRVRPGEEIVNSKGGLLLNSDWDLSLSRYGQKLVVLDASGTPVSWSGSGPTDPTETYQMIGREPGLLSLRAAGDITFHGSLSDGFGDSVQPASEVDFVRGLYFAPLIPLLARDVTAEGQALNPVSQSSWSYRVTAGADFASSQPDAISLQSSDISIGLPGNPLPPTTRGDGLTSQIISSSGQYQVIRTGTGDISLSASRNVQLLSPFASVYTAGALVTDPTMGGRFDLPVIKLDGQDNYGLGTSQQGSSGYPVQYASGGGNISIAAARNITRLNALLNEDGGFQYDSSGNLRLTADSSVSAVSLAGNVTMAGYGATEVDPFPYPLLRLWYDQQLGKNGIDSTIASYYVPWLRSMDFKTPFLASQLSLAPPTLSASALGGGIILQGSLTTAPSPSGDISLIASGGINGLASVGNYTDGNGIEQQVWMSSSLNLSDASPENVPGVASPLSKRSTLSEGDKGSLYANAKDSAGSYFTDIFNALFSESGSYSGSRALIETKQALHDSSKLHGNDSVPLRLIASGGDISGLTLYSAKHAEVLASGDIADVGLYLQNLASSDVSVVSAGGSFKGYDATSALRAAAVSASLLVDDEAYAQTAFPSGDIQIGGPGTLEVLAGRDIDLGNAPVYAGDSSIWVGLTSIGNARNPALSFQGADIVGGAGLNLPSGLSTTPNGLGLAEFTKQALTGEAGKTYLSELESTMTYSGHRFNKTLTEASFDPASTDLTEEGKALAQLQLFYIVLRDTGRNYNNPESPGYRSYETGEKAIAALFAKTGSGNINAWAREIRTKNGGNISLLAPGGGLSLASISTGSSLTPPGIVTEHGGGIDIFTRNNVDIGIGRIFTLRGGDITIWSDKGNIAAGYSAKTVASAPPTRVLIDPQSGDVVTDLAGLATGGGIGVLATVAGIPEGAVDLIAPTGVIDAGDAGIRATGKLNLAATAVLNAANISAGSTSGAPAAAAAPAAPNVSGATAASAASAGNNASAQAAKPPAQKDETPSIISVDVLGYGGGEKSDDDEEKPKSASIDTAPIQASL